MISRIVSHLKKLAKPLLARLQIASIAAAAREQNLEALGQRLAQAVPDLTDQYTTFKVDTPYLRLKIRTQHTFQVKLTMQAIELFLKSKPEPGQVITLVDIGDSAGTHLTYLQSILAEAMPFNLYKYKTLSVNLDPVAVEKIKAKNLDAILVRAEELFENCSVKPDISLSFEMLEHLPDPISFLKAMSSKSATEYLVITVPYLARSRVGLDYIRHRQKREVFPENTHIFELCPEDWRLIFQHCGWEVVVETIYRQFPFYSPLYMMKYIWRKLDFEGFYGVILQKNGTWAECYKT